MNEMKLSEAIREGAKLRPQAFGMYQGIDDDGRATTCALGAAYEAVVGRLPLADSKPYAPCSVVTILEVHFGSLSGVFNDITAWNDEFMWSREEIADKLEARGL